MSATVLPNLPTVLQSLSTAKPLSKIPCNEFALTEKHLLRKGLSQQRTVLSQNHHNRQLDITAIEKNAVHKYAAVWGYAVRHSQVCGLGGKTMGVTGQKYGTFDA